MSAPPPIVAFAGTPDFAVPTLRAIAAAGWRIPLVLTQPDRPAGRGRRLSASAVKEAAFDLGLRVEQPARLAPREQVETALAAVRPDLLVVVAYGLLLPAWMLEWPTHGCVNVHASLLPRWRGAAPIQHAILAGDPVTGVSLMRMQTGLDTGPVYAMLETAIGEHESGGELHARLARLGAELAVATLPSILAGRLVPAPQDDAKSTYAPKVAKSDGRLDFREPAAALARRVRAFNPWPAAFGTLADGRTLRILKARAVPGPAPGRSPGEVVQTSSEGIDVATGGGMLRVEEVQPPSSRVMSAQAYLAAHALDGARFV